MPFEKSVGAVLFRREKRKIYYLLIKHPENDGYYGHWDFPKGHIKKGEKWGDALRREIKEETGITKLHIISNFYTWYSYFYRAKYREKEERKKMNKGLNVFKLVTIYLAETNEKKVELSFEHVDYRWLKYEDAHKLLTYKQTKKILEKANRFLASCN